MNAFLILVVLLPIAYAQPLAICSDKIDPTTGVSDCPRMAPYCNNPIYKTLMTEQCPKTCGTCSGGTVPATINAWTCVDKLNPATGRSDCPNRANLCNNSVYYALMTEQCPKTCGRCPGGTVPTDIGASAYYNGIYNGNGFGYGYGNGGYGYGNDGNVYVYSNNGNSGQNSGYAYGGNVGYGQTVHIGYGNSGQNSGYAYGGNGK